MSLLLHILCADLSCLGKADPAAIPDQARMELLLARVKNKEKLTDMLGEFTSIELWDNMKVSADGRVTEIWWFFEETIAAGTVAMEWLPLQITQCTLQCNALHGSVDTAALPRGLILFDIRRNKFSGEFVIEDLPEGIEKVNIGMNGFTGELELLDLPETIVEFHVDFNKFSGSIDLSEIPPKARYLGLNHNRFQQKRLVVGDIPESVEAIHVGGNSGIARIVDPEGKEVDSDKIVLMMLPGEYGESFL